MPCIRDNDDLERLSVWQVVNRYCRDRSVICRRCKTVATAEWDVAVSSDDQRWARKVVDAGRFSTDGEKLANGNGLASGSGKGKDSRVELSGC